MKIAIVMGSVSDYDKVKEACEFLNMLEVPFEIRALSAHRTSVELDSFIEKYDDEIDVYIAAAGKAAHLPGVIAAKTCKPVIGIPIKSSTLDGLDALLSTVQLPKGIPVATVAIDGAYNAAMLAMQILAVEDDGLRAALAEKRSEMKKKVLEADEELQGLVAKK